MSPERARAGWWWTAVPTSGRSAACCSSSSRRRAYEGETVSDTLAKILEREPDLSRLPATTPARVRELIQRCLAKDARAAADIGDARIVLDEVLATGPVPGSCRSRTPRKPQREAAAARASRRSSSPPRARRRRARSAPRCGARSLRVGAVRPPTLTTCLRIAMPAGASRHGDHARRRHGRAPGAPIVADGATPAEPSLFTRAIGSYEFKELPAFDRVSLRPRRRQPERDLHRTRLAGRVTAAESEPHAARRQRPATAVVDWKQPGPASSRSRAATCWCAKVPRASSCSREGGGSTPTRKIESGVQGVSRYEFNGGQIAGTAKRFHERRRVSRRARLASQRRRARHEDGQGEGRRTRRRQRVLVADGPHGSLVATTCSRRHSTHAAWKSAAQRWPSGAVSPLPRRSCRESSNSRRAGLVLPSGPARAERPFVTVDAAGTSRPVRHAASGRLPDVPLYDGRRLATQSINARGSTNSGVVGGSRRFRARATEPNADAFFPVWSPDGRQLAYRRLARATARRRLRREHRNR